MNRDGVYGVWQVAVTVIVLALVAFWYRIRRREWYELKLGPRKEFEPLKEWLRTAWFFVLVSCIVMLGLLYFIPATIAGEVRNLIRRGRAGA